jgi:hypothetical protein
MDNNTIFDIATPSEAQAIKDGMTAGKWIFHESDDPTVPDMFFTETQQCVCSFGRTLSTGEHTTGLAPDDFDIQAILVSVNKTFVAGINPFAIPEMLAFIEKVANTMPANSTMATEAMKIASLAKLK